MNGKIIAVINPCQPTAQRREVGILHRLPDEDIGSLPYIEFHWMGGIMMRPVHTACSGLLARLGHVMAGKLHARHPNYKPCVHLDFGKLCQTLQPGDVLLVEGNERIFHPHGRLARRGKDK